MKTGKVKEGEAFHRFFLKKMGEEKVSREK